MRLFHLLFGGGRILRLIGNKEFARCTMIFLAYSENFHTIRQMYFVSSRKGKKILILPICWFFLFFTEQPLDWYNYPIHLWIDWKAFQKRWFLLQTFSSYGSKYMGRPRTWWRVHWGCGPAITHFPLHF